MIPFLRDGDQLSLDLFPGVPWDGCSPRALTQARTALFLRPEPPRHEVHMDSRQYEMWPVSVRPPRGKRPPQTAGASLLLGTLRSRRERFLREEEYDGSSTEW